MAARAAVVAIGIAIQRVLSEGPTITIVFKAGEGLEAGKTFVKYKDVNIGQVTAVQLTSDSSRVEVTAKIAKSADLMELPVTPSELTDIEQKVAGILAKLDKLPYEAIGADLTKVLVSLDQTLKDADKAVNRINAEVTPELKTTIEELRRTIATADGVLKSTNATLLGTDAPGQQELRDALQEIARAVRALDRSGQ